jgi:UDP-3-O-[3-hydroxymyristoyl] glucosamine N-acyltransferase
MMPHLGGVEIENNVVIGANNTIVAGTINPTRIGENTKFDDHVHFAHNCIAGKSCFITACAQFSGSIVLGDRVWIGPNSSLFQGIQIGDDAIVGIGAVVLKDVLEGEIIIGNPGKPLLKK